LRDSRAAQFRWAAGIALGLILAFASPASAATINVTTATDQYVAGAPCSLREALYSVTFNNATGNGCTSGEAAAMDTIVLQATTYNLNVGGPGENIGLEGDLDFRGGGPVTLRGQGSAMTTIDPANDRAIEFIGPVAPPRYSLTIDDLTITGGTVTGGGGAVSVGNHADLTITDSVISMSAATSFGGGIFVNDSDPTLTIERSVIGPGNAAPTGGGIFARNLALRDSLITGNVADGGAGLGRGGGIYSDSDATIERTTIEQNEASTEGGGLWLSPDSGEAVVLRLSRVNQNDVDAPSPGPTTGIVGAGVFTVGAVTIDRSRIQFNDITTADATDVATGAGVANYGDLTMRETTVNGNTALMSPADGRGGGISNNGSAALVNVTLSGNSAGSVGGGFRQGPGATAASLAFATIKGNTADGVTDAFWFEGVADVSLRNSIIDNGAGACQFTADVASQGNNLDAGSSCLTGMVTGDAINSSPQLGALMNNGGPEAGSAGDSTSLATHALAATSPAVDRVAPAACTDGSAAVTADERGYQRPGGARCDSGAYERTVCLGTVLDAQPAIIGTAAANTLNGTSGADLILAGAGNDRILPKGGNDKVCGGPGTDTVSFAGGAAVVGTPTSIVGQGTDSMESVENLTGSSFADRLAGSALANVLLGGGGNDRLLGLAGNDRLFGKAGRDRLRGGGGRDVCNGGKGRDRRAKGCERVRKIP